MRTVLWALILLAIFPAAAETHSTQEAPPNCALNLKASIDIKLDDVGRITVPVTINGTKKPMMVDTGAAVSSITLRSVNELNLKLRGFATDVAEFGFGGMKGKNIPLEVSSFAMESAGLLGGDFLFAFDLDFDFAAAKLNLFSRDHCPGRVVYWTHQPHGEIPFELKDNHIILKVQLDGQEIAAALHTGAADTVMSFDSASNIFGRGKATLLGSRHYPFKSLTFGDVRVGAPSILLAPEVISVDMATGSFQKSMDLVVGMGVLRRLHLYISQKEKKIYVTPATQY